MKKNEYVTPEMEIVEIKGLCSILAESLGREPGTDEDTVGNGQEGSGWDDLP